MPPDTRNCCVKTGAVTSHHPQINCSQILDRYRGQAGVQTANKTHFVGESVPDGISVHEKPRRAVTVLWKGDYKQVSNK